MKKLLALMLVLAISVSAAACSGKKTEQPTAENSEASAEVKEEIKIDKAEAEAVATGFMDALCRIDVPALTGYLGEDFANEIGFSDFREYVNQSTNDLLDGDETLKDDVAKLSGAIVDSLIKNTKYTLKSAKPEDGSWSFEFDVSSITFADLAEILESDAATVAMDKATEKYEDYTDEMIAAMTEEELIALISDMMSAMFDAYAEYIVEASEALDRYEFVCKVIISDIDGTLTVADSTDIEQFYGIFE